MAKKKTVYHCTECGAEYPKWQGFCSQCGVWNSIEEEEIIIGKQDKASRSFTAQSITASKPVRLGDIEQRSESRLSLGDPELDRVLGGGLVEGSFILLGGEPGIGKSTLVLQTILRLPYKTLYVSGEESLSQLKMRADRIGFRAMSLPEANLHGLSTAGYNIRLVGVKTVEEAFRKLFRGE